MKALHDLANIAYLGTERRPPQWQAMESLPPEIRSLLEALPEVVEPRKVLLAAGMLDACATAGYLPAKREEETVPVCPEESAGKELSSVQVQSLVAIFSEGPLRLQAEALSRLVGTGYSLPHGLLPKALDSGKGAVALRSYLLPALGQRGAWLAAQREEWHYALGASLEELDPKAWEEGALAQRQIYLTALRRIDPARARELVAAAFVEDGARERAVWMETLSENLSLDDEALLEKSLKDKGKEVRQWAMRHLSALPASRFSHRMTERLASCLSIEKKFLRGTSITIEPPEAFQSSWKDDALEEKLSGQAKGERAWWLLQMVRAAPLTWWEQHLHLSAAELIAWAQKSPWKDSLLQGWAEAQKSQKRADWAAAFLDAADDLKIPLDVTELLETLPPSDREQHFLKRWMAQGKSNTNVLSTLLDRFMASVPYGALLSPVTAREIIRHLRDSIKKGSCRYDWQLRTSLVELACLIPQETHSLLATDWDLTAELVQPFAEAIAELGIILDQRQCLTTITR